MKPSKIKTERRLDTTNNKALEVQTFGEANDYPQVVAEIVAASITGASCQDVYRKFIAGRGFAQAVFLKAVVNGEGQTANDVLNDVADDLSHFGGFALHVNYNAAYRITSVHAFPFETLRFEQLDKDGRFERLRYHPDWGKRNTARRQFNIKDAVWYDFFDPDPDTIARQVAEAGGWNGYRGQILYWSRAGERVYPTPIYAAALVPMSTESGLGNVAYRNVRNNFLPSGMILDHDNTAESEGQEEEVKKEVREFQGDENAGKLLYINVRDGATAPEFVPFEAKSYDKEFDKTEDIVPDKIGRAFNQPPILRAKDVGGNFGQDTMKNAYNYYNSITETEREVVSGVFARIFGLWAEEGINPDNDYSILPKVYQVNVTLAERLGDNSTEKVLEVLKDGSLDRGAKEATLKYVYGLEDDEAGRLLDAYANVKPSTTTPPEGGAPTI